MTIWWFAEGDKHNIGPHDTVYANNVLTSVLKTVDAVNKSESNSLKMEFPSSQSEQHKIARGFARNPGVDFPNCLAAIDGMLLG